MCVGRDGADMQTHAQPQGLVEVAVDLAQVLVEVLQPLPHHPLGRHVGRQDAEDAVAAVLLIEAGSADTGLFESGVRDLVESVPHPGFLSVGQQARALRVHVDDEAVLGFLLHRSLLPAVPSNHRLLAWSRSRRSPL